MKRFIVVLVAVVLLVGVIAFAGEKEDLAIQILTTQEEQQVIRNSIQAKQKEYQALKAQYDKADPTKKGELAVKIVLMDEEFRKLNDQFLDLSRKIADLKQKFGKLVKEKK